MEVDSDSSVFSYLIDTVHLLASIGMRLFLAWFVFYCAVYAIVQSVMKERVKNLAESCLEAMGLRLHIDLKLSHEFVFTELAKKGILGLGDTFVKGFWTPGVATLDEILAKMMDKKADGERRKFFKSFDVW